MYRGKRYNESRFGRERRPNIVLRIVISVALAVIISFGLILLGASLGEMVPEESGTTSAETTTAPAPEPEFKNVDARIVSEKNAAGLFSEGKPELAILNVSDENGKLNCITSINSMLYGNAVSSELRPIEALLYEAKTLCDGVSVRFTPFSVDDYGILCSRAVICALSEYEETEEIVINLDGVSCDLAASLRESARGRVAVGGMLSADVLENEELVKEYYNALDFLVVDLTGLDIRAYSAPIESEAAETTEAAETDTETVPPSSGDGDASVESILECYGLLIIKYSVRPRVTCATSEQFSDFLVLYDEFELCGYEIDGTEK